MSKSTAGGAAGEPTPPSSSAESPGREANWGDSQGATAGIAGGEGGGGEGGGGGDGAGAGAGGGAAPDLASLGRKMSIESSGALDLLQVRGEEIGLLEEGIGLFVEY